MALRCYMAITGADYKNMQVLPQHPAWMACQFSGYGTGLSNLPKDFPEGGMIILNDLTPIHNHDPEQICRELQNIYEAMSPGSFLLDFQRPGVNETAQLAKLLCQALPCPVGVSHMYAQDLDCPVFLPPPPPHKSLEDHLSVWKDREVWLEIAQESEIITVTHAGATIALGEAFSLHEPVFYEAQLCCHYHMAVFPDRAVFYLERQQQDLSALLAQADTLGVTCAVGLYHDLQ